MKKVVVVMRRNGARKEMAPRFAEILVKLGAAEIVGADDQEEGQEFQLSGSVIASEAVRQFAAEHGIDIATVTGTGKDGRINKGDIQIILDAKTQSGT